MLLNPQKHNPTSFKVIINNNSISPEDKLKYLSVLLDNLSWKPHEQKVKTQLSRACGVLTKLKHYTTQLMYLVNHHWPSSTKEMILPNYYYISTLYHNCSSTLLVC